MIRNCRPLPSIDHSQLPPSNLISDPYSILISHKFFMVELLVVCWYGSTTIISYNWPSKTTIIYYHLLSQRIIIIWSWPTTIISYWLISTTIITIRIYYHWPSYHYIMISDPILKRCGAFVLAAHHVASGAARDDRCAADREVPATTTNDKHGLIMFTLVFIPFIQAYTAWL